MGQMTEAFKQMNHSLEKNLKNMNRHIREVQNGDVNA